MHTSSYGKLALIIGPSGAGKSAVLTELKQKHAEYHFPRSATTRARRDGEGDQLYHFVSDAEFDRLLSDNQFLEWAVVHGGARYGTLISEIIPFIQQGKTVVREVDVQGFGSIAAHQLFRGTEAPYKLVSIFILPESRAQLIERIRTRAPISEEELERRIASMDHELAYAQQCDVEVVNVQGKLAETVAAVEAAL